jgi:diacylglycerol kinase (ATP)
MRVKVILNPCADLGRGIQKKEVIENEGAKWGDLDLVVSDHQGHAGQLAYEAVQEGYDVVAAAGGDGTVHEVVNGLMQVGKPQSKLGIIPIGSGNDYAYAMNISNDIPVAVKHVFHSQSHPIDLAEIVDDRGIRQLFANNLGIGFDANVVIRVQAISKLHGFPKYFWGVLKTLALDFRPFRFKMCFDDEECVEDILFVAFGIGSRHGGGFMLTPNALHDDDKIDTCSVRNMSRLQALRFLNSAVQGTHIQNPLVSMRQNKHIEISCDEPLPIHIDGEVFAYPQDDVHQLTITSLPAALEVLA